MNPHLRRGARRGRLGGPGAFMGALSLNPEERDTLEDGRNSGETILILETIGNRRKIGTLVQRQLRQCRTA